MGFSYEEYKNLSWAEFHYYNEGYNRRIEKDWELNASLISSIFNANGSKKTIKPEDIYNFIYRAKIQKNIIKPDFAVFKKIAEKRKNHR